MNRNDGPKRIQIRATDGVGNVELAPYGIDFSLILDTQAPKITITPRSMTYSLASQPYPVLRLLRETRELKFELVIDDVSPITNISFSINRTLSTVLSYPSIETFETQNSAMFHLGVSNTSSSSTSSRMRDGTYFVEIHATDTVGQTNKTKYIFIGDGTPPVTTVALENGQVDGLITTATTMSIVVSAEDALVAVELCDCSLDGGPNREGCHYALQTYAKLQDGPHVFRAWSYDELGNGHANDPVTVKWTVDLTPPTLSVELPSTTDNVLLISLEATCDDKWSDCYVAWDIQVRCYLSVVDCILIVY